MNLAFTNQGIVTIVTIQGSIDGLNSENLTQALMLEVEADHIRLVADMSGVSYISSAGLRSLLITLKNCRAKNGDFRLASIQTAVLNVLTVSGFTKMFRLFDDVPTAVSSYTA